MLAPPSTAMSNALTGYLSRTRASPSDLTPSPHARVRRMLCTVRQRPQQLHRKRLRARCAVLVPTALQLQASREAKARYERCNVRIVAVVQALHGIASAAEGEMHDPEVAERDCHVRDAIVLAVGEEEE